MVRVLAIVVVVCVCVVVVAVAIIALNSIRDSRRSSIC